MTAITPISQQNMHPTAQQKDPLNQQCHLAVRTIFEGKKDEIIHTSTRLGSDIYFVTSHDNKYTLRCARKGDLRSWEFEHSLCNEKRLRDLQIYDNTFYVQSKMNGEIYRFALTDNRITSFTTFSAPYNIGRMRISDGSIFILDGNTLKFDRLAYKYTSMEDSRLYQLDANTGKQKAEYVLRNGAFDFRISGATVLSLHPATYRTFAYEPHGTTICKGYLTSEVLPLWQEKEAFVVNHGLRMFSHNSTICQGKYSCYSLDSIDSSLESGYFETYKTDSKWVFGNAFQSYIYFVSDREDTVVKGLEKEIEITDRSTKQTIRVSHELGLEKTDLFNERICLYASTQTASLGTLVTGKQVRQLSLTNA